MCRSNDNFFAHLVLLFEIADIAQKINASICIFFISTQRSSVSTSAQILLQVVDKLQGALFYGFFCLRQLLDAREREREKGSRRKSALERGASGRIGGFHECERAYTKNERTMQLI